MSPAPVSKSIRKARLSSDKRPSAPKSKKSDRFVAVAAGKLGKQYRDAYLEQEEEDAERIPPNSLQPRPVERRPPPLKLQDLEITRTLGEGSGGRVYMVRTRRADHPLDIPNTIFALKAVKKDILRSQYDPATHIAEKDRERRALVDIPWNPFIAGLVQTFDDRKNLYLMLECIPCGTLQTLIQRESPMPPASVAFYFANIVSVIDFLHYVGYCHRDIKPENFLLGEDGYLCLTDFGLAVSKTDPARHWDNHGTPLYSAPEQDVAMIGGIDNCAAVEDDGEESQDSNQGGSRDGSRDGSQDGSWDLDSDFRLRASIDWYASGIILYEMATKKVPYFSRNAIMTAIKKREGSFTWPENVRLGKCFKELVKSLISNDPSQRPSPYEIREHPWLSHIDWEKLEAKQYLPPYLPNRFSKLESRWHALPLPAQRDVPGVAIAQPPVHLAYDNRFPEKHLGL